MKWTPNRILWLSSFLVVLLLPVLLYALEGGRAQTSIAARLLSLTGVQIAGLLVYTIALGGRLKSRTTVFGLPLHKWSGTCVLVVLLFHILLAIMADPDNIWILTMLWTTSKGAAGAGALYCLLTALLLGEQRRRTKLNSDDWRTLHIWFAWLGAILGMAHILWIDQLVNDPIWLLLFTCIVLATILSWLTKPKIKPVRRE